MQGDQIQEVINIHVHNAMFSAFSVVLIVIGDCSVCHVQYPGVRDSHPVSISCDILQHLVDSLGWRSRVNHPGFIKALLSRILIHNETFTLEPSCQHGDQLPSESRAHGRNGKEEAGVSTSLEIMPHAGLIYTTTGHNAVQVRMVEEVGTPCMEYGCHAGANPLTGCKDLDGVPSRLEHAVVEDGLMRHGYIVQTCRYGEDYVEVLCWDNLLPSAGNPLFTLLVLALWAMPVTAAVVTDLDFSAVRTSLHVSPKRFCPANRHVSKGLSDRCDDLMTTEKPFSMLTDNLTDVKLCPHL